MVGRTVGKWNCLVIKSLGLGEGESRVAVSALPHECLTQRTKVITEICPQLTTKTTASSAKGSQKTRNINTLNIRSFCIDSFLNCRSLLS